VDDDSEPAARTGVLGREGVASAECSGAAKSSFPGRTGVEARTLREAELGKVGGNRIVRSGLLGVVCLRTEGLDDIADGSIGTEYCVRSRTRVSNAS